MVLAPRSPRSATVSVEERRIVSSQHLQGRGMSLAGENKFTDGASSLKLDGISVLLVLGTWSYPALYEAWDSTGTKTTQSIGRHQV